jgi:DNA-binding CsgD family transcriptional regulator
LLHLVFFCTTPASILFPNGDGNPVVFECIVVHTTYVLSQEKVLRLVGRIYDAAADESLWPAFLEDFAIAVNGEATALFYCDMIALRAGLAITVGFDPECEDRYVKHYSAFDILRSEWLQRFSQAGPEGVVTCEQLVEPPQLRKTEYFNDFLRRYDIVHQFCGPIAVNAEWSSVFSCSRSRKKGPFGPEAVNLLRLLLPHLQRALQFHREFAELKGQQRASLDALDQLPFGVILLDCDGRIIASNREANCILSQNDGLSADRHGINAAWQNETQELRRMIAGAGKTVEAQGMAAGGILALQRPSGKRPLAVLVAPVGRQAFEPGIKTPAVIVFVTDPEQKRESLPGALQRIYELTAAESRVAELLMQGESVMRAAERLGVSHNTARTHLQRIYDKTDTRHQAELVRLLLIGVGNLLPKATAYVHGGDAPK